MLLAILTLHFIATAVVPEPFATVAPPFHLSHGEESRTILVCMVSDLPLADVQVMWISSMAAQSRQIAYRSERDQDGSHRALSVVSVASSQWMTFMCFVSYRSSNYETKLYIEHPDAVDNTCSEELTFEYGGVHMKTDALYILVLRVLLFKTAIFNFLMTAKAVMKCGDAMGAEPVVNVDLEGLLVHSLSCVAPHVQGA